MTTHRRSNTAEYRAWAMAKHRCSTKKGPDYKNYGLRGITMAPEWLNSFQAFYEHVGPRPTNRHTLDRINNDKGYEPGNIRWATRQQQSRNRRYCPTPQRIKAIRVIVGSHRQIAAKFGITHTLVRNIKNRTGRYRD